LAVAITFIGCGDNSHPGTPTSERLDAEECVVYSSLIRNMYKAELIVIKEETESFTVTEETLKYIKKVLPEIEQETLGDFKEKNKNNHTLIKNSDIEGNNVFIAEKEAEDIFKEKNGWDEFYEKYPNSQGIMSLSRVGFNGKKNQALVSVGNQSHWLAGNGYYILLVKENNIWLIKGKVLSWIS